MIVQLRKLFNQILIMLQLSIYE